VAGRPQVEFACGEIRAALASQRVSALRPDLGTQLASPVQGSFRFVIAASVEESRNIAIRLGVKPLRPGFVPQAYSIRKFDAGIPTHAVLAADPVGAMYGGLDLAAAVGLGTLSGVTNGDHAPFISNRGIKFNIPLDVRTPSYLDAGDSAQQNIPEVGTSPSDELARQR
jgi:hypothetical protein